MKCKQTAEQLDRELELLKKKMGPYQLVCITPRPNEFNTATKDSGAINEMMEKLYTDSDGLTDYTADNLYRVICKLKEQLTWRVAPKGLSHATVVEMAQELRDNADPFGKRAHIAARARADVVTDDRVQQTARNACQELVLGHQAMRGGRVDHAKTARERQMLSEFRVWTDASKIKVDWAGTLAGLNIAIREMGEKASTTNV